MVGWKGLITLLSVLEVMPHVEWWAAGDGPERVALEVKAKESGVQDRIRWCGVLNPSELREVMQRADFMIQPSWDFDACPTAVLQGMSCGLPLILSDQVGLKTLIKNHAAFQVVPARDSQAIVQVLQDWGTSDSLQKEARSASRQAALDQFSWVQLAEKLEKEWGVSCKN